MGLIGSTGPFPTTPPPPCVERCSPAPGQNTPECNGQTKARCQQMVQYENKCQWTETTTTRPALGQCKAWCASNGKSWEKKCTWTGCAGCPSCNTRRLRASNRFLV